MDFMASTSADILDDYIAAGLSQSQALFGLQHGWTPQRTAQYYAQTPPPSGTQPLPIPNLSPLAPPTTDARGRPIYTPEQLSPGYTGTPPNALGGISGRDAVSPGLSPSEFSETPVGIVAQFLPYIGPALTAGEIAEGAYSMALTGGFFGPTNYPPGTAGHLIRELNTARDRIRHELRQEASLLDLLRRETNAESRALTIAGLHRNAHRQEQLRAIITRLARRIAHLP
jgi:hypothetical protein